MAGVNKVILVGNLGKDPEMRTFNNGDSVANFSVATSESWKDKQTGEKKTQTEWHNVSAFRKLAEICEKYLKKGDKVYIEGKLKTDKYEKDGVTKYTTRIIADQMQMLGSKSDEGQVQSQEPDQPTQNLTSQNKEFDDDIPF